MSQTPGPSAPSPSEYPYAPRPPAKAQAKADRPRRRLVDQTGLWMLVSVAGLALLADLLVLPLMKVFDQRDWGAVWVYVCMGLIVAQGGALTVWLAWGPEPFWLRLLGHWCLAGVALAFWLLGVWAAEGPNDLREALGIVGPALPLVSLAAQAPLWLVRQFCGWRLVPREAPPDAAAPLSIRDLMVATLLAGLSLAAARGVDGGGSRNEEFWLFWGIAVAIATGIGTIALLPAGGWLLGTRRLALGVSLTAAYAAIATGAVWIVALFLVSGSRLRVWDLTGLSIIVLSFTGMLVLAAHTARTWGYGLIYGRRRDGKSLTAA